MNIKVYFENRDIVEKYNYLARLSGLSGSAEKLEKKGKLKCVGRNDIGSLSVLIPRFKETFMCFHYLRHFLPREIRYRFENCIAGRQVYFVRKERVGRLIDEKAWNSRESEAR